MDTFTELKRWAKREDRRLKGVCWARWQQGMVLREYLQAGGDKHEKIKEASRRTGRPPGLLWHCYRFAWLCPIRDAAKDCIDHMGSWSRIVKLLPQDPDQVMHYAESTAMRAEEMDIPEDRKAEMAGALYQSGLSMLETAKRLTDEHESG